MSLIEGRKVPPPNTLIETNLGNNFVIHNEFVSMGAIDTIAVLVVHNIYRLQWRHKMVVITSSRLKSALFLFTTSPVKISMRSQLMNHYHTLTASSLQRGVTAFCVLG